MEQDELVMVRQLSASDGAKEYCYYSKSLYFDELYVAGKISRMKHPPPVDKNRVESWVDRYCQIQNIPETTDIFI